MRVNSRVKEINEKAPEGKEESMKIPEERDPSSHAFGVSHTGDTVGAFETPVSRGGRGEGEEASSVTVTVSEFVKRRHRQGVACTSRCTRVLTLRR